MEIQESLYKQICRILIIDDTLIHDNTNKKINKSITVLHKDYLLNSSREARNVVNRTSVANKYNLMISIYNRKIKEHQALMLLIQLFEIAVRTKAAIVLSKKFSTQGQDDWYWLTPISRNHGRLKNKVSDRARMISLAIIPNTSTLDMFHSLMLNDIQVLYQRNWSDFTSIFNKTTYKNNTTVALDTHAKFNARFERIRKYRNNLYHGNPGRSGWSQIIDDIEDILVQLGYNLKDAIDNIDPNHRIITFKYTY